MLPQIPKKHAIGVILALTFAGCGKLSFGDRIVLRRFEIISDQTVTSFDEDGVKLSGGSTLTWDDIERGTVDATKQEAFDQMLKKLGTPLYRIRQRLKVGDYEGLLEQAEALYPTYLSRKSSTAFMVFQSLMWARIAAGQRELAVEPHLRAYEYLRATRAGADSLPGDRRPSFDPKTALSPELQPIWFDVEDAKAALPGVRLAAREMAQPRPDGVFLYYASLAITAGEFADAEKMLDQLTGTNATVTQFRQILSAQQELMEEKTTTNLESLDRAVDKISSQARPTALYWLGMWKTKSADRAKQLEGVLHLTHLPALFGDDHPELAAAGLYHSMKALDDMKDYKGSFALRRELLVRYAHTLFANKAKADAKTKSGSGS